MAKFIVRRVVFLVLTLIGVSIAVFVITELGPGNIAINTLGNTITPEQEASFNAQNGLDDTAFTRYIRWMFGSDWQAERLVGYDLVQYRDPENERTYWYARDEDGTLFQNETDDAETMYRLVLQEDGSKVREALPESVWAFDPEQNAEVFWGVTERDQVAMWVRGRDADEWVLGHNQWNSSAGAPADYVPLQRGLVRGDPGMSFMDRRPVAEVLPRRALNTFVLAGAAFAIVMPLALVLGILAGLNEGSTLDRVLSIGSLVATATPEFASGIFLILIFSTWLGWFPGAIVQTSQSSLFDKPLSLVLPVLTLTLIELGYVLRITRASMIDVMSTHYIRTAVLKGVPQWQIVLKHALRNALMAPITIIMLHVNWLIGGIVVVETLFGYPGLGRYVLDAALFKDVFAIEAAAMVLVIIAVGTQLIADIIYTYLNPRIRYS